MTSFVEMYTLNRAWTNLTDDELSGSGSLAVEVAWADLGESGRRAGWRALNREL